MTLKVNEQKLVKWLIPVSWSALTGAVSSISNTSFAAYLAPEKFNTLSSYNIWLTIAFAVLSFLGGFVTQFIIAVARNPIPINDIFPEETVTTTTSIQQTVVKETKAPSDETK